MSVVLEVPVEKEIWVLCPGFSKYRISNVGRILKISTLQLLKHSYPSYGYATITLQANFRDHENNGTSKVERGHVVQVHRLVAKAFIPYPENKREVNHKNGDKGDCRASNLEWVTHQENIQHAWDTGLMVQCGPAISRANKGKRLSNERSNAKSVRCMTTGQVFGSIAEAAREMNCDYSQVSRCCNSANHAVYAGRHPVTRERLTWEFE